MATQDLTETQPLPESRAHEVLLQDLPGLDEGNPRDLGQGPRGKDERRKDKLRAPAEAPDRKDRVPHGPRYLEDEDLQEERQKEAGGRCPQNGAEEEEGRAQVALGDGGQGPEENAGEGRDPEGDREEAQAPWEGRRQHLGDRHPAACRPAH